MKQHLAKLSQVKSLICGNCACIRRCDDVSCNWHDFYNELDIIAVEDVVYCRDCKYAEKRVENDRTLFKCDKLGIDDMSIIDYCSKGKKKR